MRRPLLALVLILALAPACTDRTPATPTAPQPLNLSGVWRGNIAVAGAAAIMTWTLTQSSTAVAGPVLVALPSGTVLVNGALTGTLSGSTLTYTIAVSPGGIPAQPACGGQLAGTMTAAIAATSTLSGTLTVSSSTCPTPFVDGNLTLTKQ
jgi:hypothetical protein